MNLKLSSKISLFALVTIGLSSLLGLGLYHTSLQMFTHYLLQSDYMIQQEKEPIKQFQTFVSENHIRTSHLVQLNNYCESKQFPYLAVMKQGHLVYYWNMKDLEDVHLFPSAPGLELNRLWRFYLPVEFQNGQAAVFLDTGHEDSLYALFTFLSISISIIFGMTAYLIFLRTIVKQIRYLNEQVDRLRNKNYDQKIKINGHDELAQLANHVDILRKRLNDDVLREEEMKKETYSLMSGIAHDFRTPLSNIRLYLELLERQGYQQKLIKNASQNVDSLQILYDELFEYILLHSKKTVILNRPVSLFSAIGDHLSEMYALLLENHFVIDDSHLEFYKLKVQVNDEYITRICQNIYSNLLKYADHQIMMYSRLTKDFVIIGIKNKIGTAHFQSTGIGVRNICMMMEEMQGKCYVEANEEVYAIELFFPVIR